MHNTTHTNFITGQINGEPFSAFVTGVPDTCEHDSIGPILVFTDEGDYFKESDIPDHDTDFLAHEIFFQDHSIRGSCTSCSKCNKPFEFNPFETLDF